MIQKCLWAKFSIRFLKIVLGSLSVKSREMTLCSTSFQLMQPSMCTLNSPSSRFVKDSTRSRRQILRYMNFRDWWILTHFLFGLRESSPNNIWSTVNLEQTFFLLFYYFLCLNMNLDLEKTNQLGESSSNFVFAVVNLDPIILEKRWIDGESWPNDFVEKVNRGEDLRWVGSRCPLAHA